MDTICDRLNDMQADIKTDVYNGLALALNYPDAGLVEDLRSGGYLSPMAETMETLGLPDLAARALALEGTYTKPASHAPEQLLELEKEYTRMCFSSKPRQVYLFESVYNEGKLLQESTFQIARLYYEAGLHVEDDFRLPPDHIAVELEFMAYLCFNEGKSIRAANKDREHYARRLQRTVLDAHLGSFACALGDKLGTHAKTGFYQLIARILQDLFGQFRTSLN